MYNQCSRTLNSWRDVVFAVEEQLYKRFSGYESLSVVARVSDLFFPLQMRLIFFTKLQFYHNCLSKDLQCVFLLYSAQRSKYRIHNGFLLISDLLLNYHIKQNKNQTHVNVMFVRSFRVKSLMKAFCQFGTAD